MNTPKIARMFVALSAVAVTLLPAAAGAQSAPVAAPAQAGHTRPLPGGAEQRPITVSYYAGNPAQGGKLLSKVTLTRPQRGPQPGQPQPGQPQPGAAGRDPQAQPQAGQPQAGQPGKGHHRRGHHNPLLSQAPKGATYAIITDEHGSHVIDLTKPMPRPQGQEAQPGQPVPPQK